MPAVANEQEPYQGYGANRRNFKMILTNCFDYLFYMMFGRIADSM